VIEDSGRVAMERFSIAEAGFADLLDGLGNPAFYGRRGERLDYVRAGGLPVFSGLAVSPVAPTTGGQDCRRCVSCIGHCRQRRAVHRFLLSAPSEYPRKIQSESEQPSHRDHKHHRLQKGSVAIRV